MLIGRDREQRQVAALLDEARRGRSGTLVVAGEAGVGKSALLAEGRRLASDMRVLAATGVESESELPFASLHELLRPALDLMPRLPSTQAQSLAVALALEEGEPDPLSVRAGTLSLLVEAAEEAPVLVVLDDVQWLDKVSSDALAFAARRLRAEEIAVLAAVRSGVSSAFDAFPRLELGPLADDHARRLLSQRAEPVPAAEEARLLAASGGNPLALLELPVELAGELPTSATSLERLRRTFLPRVHELPEGARLGLLVAAAEADARVASRAAAALGVLDPLTQVEATGLARADGEKVVFRHPVVRSLLYADARTAERRAVHRALADVLAGAAADSDRRAWHLAAAAEGPDDEVAALLEATAAHAASRGGYVAQASALEHAARLSLDPDDVSRRLARAANAAASAGDVDRALRLADEAVASARDPLVRTRAVLEQTVAMGRADPASYDQGRFLAEIGNIERLDPSYATRALETIVNRRNEALDLAGARELLPQLERLARRAVPARRMISLACAAEVYLASGERDAFARLFAAFRDDTSTVTSSAIDLVWAEEYDAVAYALETEARAARSSGELLRVLWIDACLAHLDLRLGRLQEAKLAASNALTLAEACGVARFGCVASCALAGVHAWQGEADACRRTAAEALSIAREARLVSFEFSAKASLGLLAIGSGRPADAVEELAPEAQRWKASALVEPSIVAFVPDLIEAYAQSGMIEDAVHWLERFSEAARAADRTWALAACARCEGLLASAETFDEPFARALSLHEGSPLALERARTQLAYGERLRRKGSRLEARAQLRPAYEAFAAVSATPWQTRALSELRATGERVIDEARPLPELTPQELQISMLVADGKTNKEIAATIYLSPKTIEYHLANAYRKLDIHSRAELARIVARDAS